MKRRRVVWSQAAIDDLIVIAEYIAQENSVAARKVAKAIRTTGTKLGIGAVGHRGRVSGTYEKPVAKYPYILAYALRSLPDGSEEVVVLHAIHMKRLWEEESWPTSK